MRKAEAAAKLTRVRPTTSVVTLVDRRRASSWWRYLLRGGLGGLAFAGSAVVVGVFRAFFWLVRGGHFTPITRADWKFLGSLIGASLTAGLLIGAGWPLLGRSVLRVLVF